jgi:hypothetical protein
VGSIVFAVSFDFASGFHKYVMLGVFCFSLLFLFLF